MNARMTNDEGGMTKGLRPGASVYELRPEPKFERAQDAQRGVIARTRAILERDVSEEMGADDLEVLALQFKLAGANLMTSARELREVEEERRRLVTVMERERVRFEAEPPEHAEA